MADLHSVNVSSSLAGVSVAVAQLVRVSGCEPEGYRFESDLSPYYLERKIMTKEEELKIEFKNFKFQHRTLCFILDTLWGIGVAIVILALLVFCAMPFLHLAYIFHMMCPEAGFGF